MNIRELTALVTLYRACLRAEGVGELRLAAHRATQLVPPLAELGRPEWPFRSHRTMAEVMRDEAKTV